MDIFICKSDKLLQKYIVVVAFGNYALGPRCRQYIIPIVSDSMCPSPQ